MTQKILISKAGYNVLTETNIDNLIFSSDYNTLKYYVSGGTTVVVNQADYYRDVIIGSTTWYYHTKVTTIAHNLGYSPYFTTYYDTGGVYNMCPKIINDSFEITHIGSYVDSTNIYFVVKIKNQEKTGSVTYNFNYKIFKNDTGL